MIDCILFEDDAVEHLYPISLARPAYRISCGGYQLIELLSTQFRCLGWVRPHLSGYQSNHFPELDQQVASDQKLLMINARVVPSVANLCTLVELASSDEAIYADGQLLAGRFSAEDVIPVHSDTYEEKQAFLKSLCSPSRTSRGHLSVFARPHDVVRENMDVFGSNLSHRLETTSYKEVRPGLFTSGENKISDFVVIDDSEGPVVMESGVQIGPFSLIRGPVYIGKNVKIQEHAAIKDCVHLASTTKVGGEIETTVVESYSNKQHHGFLGHSYLGSWVNLGAGTTNSDLKNTYGSVKMTYPDGPSATGMQFLGTIVGDYSKTAINTGIFTGKTIGVCSMMYGMVTTNVPSFVNYARMFGAMTEVNSDVMIATQQRMFERRNVTQTPSDIQLMHDLHQLTRDERKQLTDEPLAL